MLSVLRRPSRKEDRRTVTPCSFNLHPRGLLRHHDRGGDAEVLGGKRNSLAMVAGGIGDDAVLALGGRQLREHVEGTAQLERAGALQVLAFEDTASATGIYRLEDWRAARDRRNAFS